MNVGLYSGLSAMQMNESRLEALTANLANVDTPAYKRRTSAAHAFFVGNQASGGTSVGTSHYTDFSQGQLERTGNTFDLALMGEGFFAVQAGPDELYTRSGNFQVDEAGTLQTIDGYPVNWNSSSRSLDPVGEPVTVDGSGTVFQGDAEVGQLRIVNYPAADQLTEIGPGYYSAPRTLKEVPTDAEVHQYALERSNVSSVDELIGLITVQRNFESASNLLRQIDQTYKTLYSSR